MSTQIPSDMGALLLELLHRRMQVRFTQSSGNPIGSWPPAAGDRTKCWVRLEGHGELAASEWCESPADALAEAHARAFDAMRPTLGDVLYRCAQQSRGNHPPGDSHWWRPMDSRGTWR